MSRFLTTNATWRGGRKLQVIAVSATSFASCKSTVWFIQKSFKTNTLRERTYSTKSVSELLTTNASRRGGRKLHVKSSLAPLLRENCFACLSKTWQGGSLSLWQMISSINCVWAETVPYLEPDIQCQIFPNNDPLHSDLVPVKGND